MDYVSKDAFNADHIPHDCEKQQARMWDVIDS